MLRFFVLLLTAFFAASAWAAPATEPEAGKTEPSLYNANAKEPNVESIPTLAKLAKQGAKIYFLGERSGLTGWFVSMNGQVQVLYVTPDKKTALMGLMFAENGAAVTGQQIKTLLTNNKEIASSFMKPINKLSEADRALLALRNMGNVTAMKNPQSLGDTAAALNSLSPGERLYREVKESPGVDFGHNDKAQVLMLARMQCPSCKLVWQQLREKVAKNEIQVQVTPFGADPLTEKLAARLLSIDNALEAWNKYIDGDMSALEGDVDELHLKAVQMNADLVHRWKIPATPALIYRDKQGKVKIIHGEPKDMAALFADLPQ